MIELGPIYTERKLIRPNEWLVVYLWRAKVDDRGTPPIPPLCCLVYEETGDNWVCNWLIFSDLVDRQSSMAIRRAQGLFDASLARAQTVLASVPSGEQVNAHSILDKDP